MVGIIDTFSDVSKERFIANYDFLDVCSGRAYQTYYLGTEKKTGGETDIIENTAFWSNSIATVITTNGANWPNSALEDTSTFDVTLNVPTIVKGDALISMNFGIRSPGANTAEIYLIISICKGATALVSGTTETLSATNQNTTKMLNMRLTVPSTHFAAGDILRVKILTYMKADASMPGGYCHDPKSRDCTTVPFATGEETTAQLLLPIKVEI